MKRHPDLTPENLLRTSCGTSAHFTRRSILGLAGLGGLHWLSPIGSLLAQTQESRGKHGTPRSIIMLWLEGGPSQVDTFDPHPNLMEGEEKPTISTALRDVRFARGLERLAEHARDLTIIRNVVSLEGDHERAMTCVKTGHRPEPTVIYPSLGAVVWHAFSPIPTELPGHISILPTATYGRGGYLGAEYDAFRVDNSVAEPRNTIPAVRGERWDRRLKNLQFMEDNHQPTEKGTAGRPSGTPMLQQALQLMGSQRLQAFDVRDEPARTREAFGDSDFGRACLAAVRLVEAGVPCIEVTLPGWDSHLANQEIHDYRKGILDPAFSALISELKARDLFERTVILCGGEFGRTPKLNGAGGRDHWPHGFSLVMAGGQLRRGVCLGTTDPKGSPIPKEMGTQIPDLHATLLTALDIDPATEWQTSAGRPVKLSDGKPIAELLA
jgi:Protein of unknown function (DUF1501)